MFDLNLIEARAAILPVLSEPLPFDAQILANYMLNSDHYVVELSKGGEDIFCMLQLDDTKPQGFYTPQLVTDAIKIATGDAWIKQLAAGWRQVMARVSNA